MKCNPPEGFACNCAYKNARTLLGILLSKSGCSPWFTNMPGFRANGIHYYYAKMPGSF